MNAPVTVIVLAAGAAGRLTGAGQKRAQALEGNDDAGTVLGATLRNAVGSGLPVLVVISAELAPLALQQLAARDVVILPPARRTGMGDSIAAGVSASADAAGWLLLPADMPRVRSTTMTLVSLALQTHAVAYAQHRGRRGHPVGFAAELFSELVALSGDDGVRRLVARYPAQAVEVDDPGVLIDIQTVEDLAAMRAVKGGIATPAAAPRRH